MPHVAKLPLTQVTMVIKSFGCILKTFPKDLLNLIYNFYFLKMNFYPISDLNNSKCKEGSLLNPNKISFTPKGTSLATIDHVIDSTPKNEINNEQVQIDSFQITFSKQKEGICAFGFVDLATKQPENVNFKVNLQNLSLQGGFLIIYNVQ